MAVTAFWYANALKYLLDRTLNIDVDTNTLKLALTTSSYTPNQDTHNAFDDVTNEVTGTGYTAGGASLSNVSINVTNNVVTLRADPVAWASSTITARRAVLYDTSGGADNARALILWIDFGQDESSSSGTFTVDWSGANNDIATLTAADATGFP